MFLKQFTNSQKKRSKTCEKLVKMSLLKKQIISENVATKINKKNINN